MSKQEFKLEHPPVSTAVFVTDREWLERIDKLTSESIYRKLGIWDQAFLTDIHGRTAFSPRQRLELLRIWNQWGALV